MLIAPIFLHIIGLFTEKSNASHTITHCDLCGHWTSLALVHLSLIITVSVNEEPVLKKRNDSRSLSAVDQALAQKPGEVQAMYIQPMPKWEARESSLLRRLAAQEGDPNDNDSAADTASVSERGLPVDMTGPPPVVEMAPANGTTDSLVDLGALTLFLLQIGT